MDSVLAIQCLPLQEGNREEIYALVDRAIEAIDASGLHYTVGPMETVVEGPAAKLFEVAREAHLAVAAAGRGKVATYMKLFTAPDLGSSEEKTRKYRARGH